VVERCEKGHKGGYPLAMDSLRGQLLVAGPRLIDPNFHRTVVLVCEHSDEGALGLVLNRPSPLDVAQAVPELLDAFPNDGRLWVGGPVQPASVVLLAELRDPAEGALVVSGALAIVTEETVVEHLEERADRVRAFLGYAGWGPGQLEDELGEDDWIVAPRQDTDAFTDEPEGLWSTALERLGGRYRLVARMPVDPSLN
jgi:putative transcriptional regulator